MKSVCVELLLSFVPLGVKKGDHVSIYMPMVVELVVAMLACARIGAVHSIVVSQKCMTKKDCLICIHT